MRRRSCGKTQAGCFISEAWAIWRAQYLEFIGEGICDRPACAIAARVFAPFLFIVCGFNYAPVRGRRLTRKRICSKWQSAFLEQWHSSADWFSRQAAQRTL